MICFLILTLKTLANEEERRLFVAITRAKTFLTRARRGKDVTRQAPRLTCQRSNLTQKLLEKMSDEDFSDLLEQSDATVKNLKTSNLNR